MLKALCSSPPIWNAYENKQNIRVIKRNSIKNPDQKGLSLSDGLRLMSKMAVGYLALSVVKSPIANAEKIGLK